MVQPGPTIANGPISTILLVAAAILVLVFLFILLKFFKLWIQAYFSKADVTLFSLVGMWLRKVNASVIVNSKITAVQAGLKISTQELESLYLAGGHVPNVVRALVAVGTGQSRFASLADLWGASQPSWRRCGSARSRAWTGPWTSCGTPRTSSPRTGCPRSTRSCRSWPTSTSTRRSTRAWRWACCAGSTWCSCAGGTR